MEVGLGSICWDEVGGRGGWGAGENNLVECFLWSVTGRGGGWRALVCGGGIGGVFGLVNR